MNNLAVMCYQSLIEAENKHHQINEMIMAPRFAKLLNESVDPTDFEIHKSKTNELISEFVSESFDNMEKLLEAVETQLETITPNNRLIATCEMKMKSLTRDDRDNLALECNVSNNLLEYKNEIMKDINTVEEEFGKILEASFETKEEYSNAMNSFRTLVSESFSKLEKVDLSKEEKNISMEELSDIIVDYKNTDIITEKNVFAIKSLKDKLKSCKGKKSKSKTACKEAVYLASGYLMRANCVLESVLSAIHADNEEVLSEFVFSESSEDASTMFESTISSMIYSDSFDDDDDFIK